jgi:hypothetical protein
MSYNYIINLYKTGKISYLTLAYELGNSRAELVRDILIKQKQNKTCKRYINQSNGGKLK